jgi:preprotein translocase subunit SecG
MVIAITILHIVVCIGLILVVLLQTGKGAEIGAVFGGGSSSTIFGSSGAGNFLTKLTTGMAIVFMITSLALGYFAGQRPSATIFDDRSPATQPGPSMQPAAPAKEESGSTPGASGAPAAAKDPQTEKATNP